MKSSAGKGKHFDELSNIQVYMTCCILGYSLCRWGLLMRQAAITLFNWVDSMALEFAKEEAMLCQLSPIWNEEDLVV